MGDINKLVAETYLQVQRLLDGNERLTAEIALLRLQIEGKLSKTEGWMASTKAASALQDEGVKSSKHLRRLRLDGAFSEDKGEIRNVSQGNRPTWEYNVPKCRKALQHYFSTLSESQLSPSTNRR